MQSTRLGLGRLAPLAGSAWLLLFVLFPLYWMALTAFRSETAVFTRPPPVLPSGVDWRVAVGALQGANILSWLRNSIIVSSSALVAASFAATLLAIHLAYREGLRVGRDLDLVGGGDPRWGFLVTPPIPLLRVDAFRLGVVAAELLEARIADPGLAPAAPEVIVPIDLVAPDRCVRRPRRRPPSGRRIEWGTAVKIERVDSLVLGGVHFVQITTDTGLVGLGQSACWSYPEATHALLGTFRR